jgi:hypothetical protein
MSQFDLKPLTQDIIQQLGLSTDSLWKVKFGEEVFGPFDTPSLVHYALANPDLMEEAQACHPEQEEWKSFYSYKEFKKVEEDHAAEEAMGQFYWLLESGVKSEKYPREFIEKKIRSGYLSRTSDISLDNGHSWKQLCHVQEFSVHFKAVSELPPAPPESSFQRAKSKVMDELEHKEESPLKSALPSFAYVAQAHANKVHLKVEELTLEDDDHIPVAKAFKWALPAVALCVGLMVFVGMQVSREKVADPLTAEADPIVKIKRKISARAVKKAPSFESSSSSPRVPASYGPRSSLTQQPTFRDDVPTHIETHVDDYGPDLSQRDSAENTMNEPAGSPEPSLVDSTMPPEDQSLDGTMNVSQAPPENNGIAELPEAQEMAPMEEAQPAPEVQDI